MPWGGLHLQLCKTLLQYRKRDINKKLDAGFAFHLVCTSMKRWKDAKEFRERLWKGSGFKDHPLWNVNDFWEPSAGQEEVSYSLISGQSDGRADIFQLPFPAQRDKRDGRESASSILTFLAAPGQQEAINKVLKQDSPIQAEETSPCTVHASLPKAQCTAAQQFQAVTIGGCNHSCWFQGHFWFQRRWEPTQLHRHPLFLYQCSVSFCF